MTPTRGWSNSVCPQDNPHTYRQVQHTIHHHHHHLAHTRCVAKVTDDEVRPAPYPVQQGLLRPVLRSGGQIFPSTTGSRCAAPRRPRGEDLILKSACRTWWSQSKSAGGEERCPMNVCPRKLLKNLVFFLKIAIFGTFGLSRKKYSTTETITHSPPPPDDPPSIQCSPSFLATNLVLFGRGHIELKGFPQADEPGSGAELT